MNIELTQGEVTEGQLSATNLDRATRFLREVGAVVVNNAVPRETVSEIHAAYVEKASGRKKLLYPPMEVPFIDHAIIANPFGLQILEKMLGKKIGWALFNAHRGAAGTGSEDGEGQDGGHIHRDGNHLFPELKVVLPVTGIYMDVPLVDFMEKNGAIRVYPGSHLIMDDPPSDVRNLPERAKELPSIQLATPAGSIILRDMRIWHSAMPNYTSVDRPWLTSLYVRVFPHASERLPLPLEIKQGLPKFARRLLRTAESPEMSVEPAED